MVSWGFEEKSLDPGYTSTIDFKWKSSLSQFLPASGVLEQIPVNGKDDKIYS